MTGFAYRLAFLRWVGDTGRLPESDAEFAKRAGVGYEWLKKWMKRDKAPNERTNTDKLAAALGVSAEWLIYAKGPTPHADLWKRWEDPMDHRPGYVQAADTFNVAIQAPVDVAQQKAPAKGARTSGQRKRRTG